MAVNWPSWSVCQYQSEESSVSARNHSSRSRNSPVRFLHLFFESGSKPRLFLTFGEAPTHIDHVVFDQPGQDKAHQPKANCRKKRADQIRPSLETGMRGDLNRPDGRRSGRRKAQRQQSGRQEFRLARRDVNGQMPGYH